MKGLNMKEKNVDHNNKTGLAGFSKVMHRFIILMILLAGFTVMNADAQKHRATILDANGERVDQVTGMSVHPDDSLALVAFYYSLHGDQWIDNSGWLQDLVEFWVGVERVGNVGTGENPEWRVLRFQFPFQNMTRPGPLPAELGMMTHLERFEMRENLITGTVPEEIGNLPRLSRLRLRDNLMSGEIPWEALGRAARLDEFEVRNNYLTGELLQSGTDSEGNTLWPGVRDFHVDNNFFTGQIPAWLGSRRTLSSFRVEKNLLTGSIPDWGNVRLSTWYNINDNNFDPGPIPDWLQQLSSTLTRFNIESSNREGQIPEWFGNMTALERLDGMGGIDPLGGEIPSNMRFLTNLQRFVLSGGNWTGNMPAWLSDMPSLQRIGFLGVNFSGTLPAEYAQLDNWTDFWMSDNSIEGGIPEAWQTNPNFQEIYIYYTTPDDLEHEPDAFEHKFQIGPIPSWMASSWTGLSRLRLENVGLSGSIPENFGNLDLMELRLARNPELVGTLPQWLSQAQLEQFDISHTGINVNGQVPAYIANWTWLNHLGLAGLGIEGPIPDWIGTAGFVAFLQVLNLSDNSFSGEIPVSLGNLRFAREVNLSNNLLEGEIPDEFGNIGRISDELTVLHTLRLSGNENLAGQFPMKIADARFMRRLEFDGTQICEPNDPAFEAFLAEIERHSTEDYYPPRKWSVKRSNIKCDTASSTEAPELSYRFLLYQNYPNPFNPGTSIRFEIPEDTHVRVTIYDVLGRQVSTLVNEQLAAGMYDVYFDAARFASGTYVYRLDAGRRSQTKSMLLLK
jgi:Leucine-rich repeat (LRR) protein